MFGQTFGTACILVKSCKRTYLLEAVQTDYDLVFSRCWCLGRRSATIPCERPMLIVHTIQALRIVLELTHSIQKTTPHYGYPVPSSQGRHHGPNTKTSGHSEIRFRAYFYFIQRYEDSYLRHCTWRLLTTCLTPLFISGSVDLFRFDSSISRQSGTACV